MNEIEQVAISAAELVGKRIKESCGSLSLQVSDKAKDDLVTEIDVWSEEQIRQQIAARFPDHQIIGEESASDLQRSTGKSLEELSSSGWWWIVDPLDGTANFVSGIPYCAVSIGVLHDGVAQVGVVLDPFRDELFAAQRGQGARMNNAPITVRQTPSPSQAVMITGYTAGHHATWIRTKQALDAYINNCRRVRVFGAAAIDQCWVACGRVDAFFEYGIKCWDVAAGTFIATEAGAISGCIIEPKNPPSLFAKSHLLANPELFPLLLDLGHEAELHGQAELRAAEKRKPRCG